MKVHLVDGTYELFRAYFGAPPAHDGRAGPWGPSAASWRPSCRCCGSAT